MAPWARADASTTLWVGPGQPFTRIQAAFIPISDCIEYHGTNEWHLLDSDCNM